MNKLRTRPITGLIVFASIAAAISLGAIILFAIDLSNLFISILVFIFGGMFFLGGVAVIIDQCLHYVELKENDLINHVIFVKKVLPIEKIKKIELVNGIYDIYDKKRKFCSLPSHLKGSSEIIVGLSRRGVEIEEKTNKRV